MLDILVIDLASGGRKYYDIGKLFVHITGKSTGWYVPLAESITEQ